MAAVEAEIAALRQLLVLAAEKGVSKLPGSFQEGYINRNGDSYRAAAYQPRFQSPPASSASTTSSMVTPLQAQIMFVLSLLAILLIVYVGPFLRWRWGLMIRRAESMAEGRERVRRLKERRGEEERTETLFAKIRNLRRWFGGWGFPIPPPPPPPARKERIDLGEWNNNMDVIEEIFHMISSYLRLFAYGISKIVLYCCGIYISYRLLTYFTLEEYARADSSIDLLLGVFVDVFVSVFVILFLPLATIFGFRSFVYVGHHDGVEICDKRHQHLH